MALRHWCFVVGLLGAAFSVRAAVVFPMDAEWQFFKGAQDASAPDPAAWRTIGFDDASWATGQAAFFYDTDTSANGYTGHTKLTDMQGGYTCIFLRRTFEVANPTAVSELQLEALSDDGFIAWINGKEVARFNMPDGEIPFNGTASPALAEPIPVQTIVLSDPSSFLVAGKNVLAVQAFNVSLSGSSDFVFNAALASSVDEAPPTVVELIPAATAQVRELKTVEVHFSEPVEGVEAPDLIINGQPATRVDAFSTTQYVFEFPEAQAGLVEVTWAAGHGIHDLATPPNAFAGGTWGYVVDPAAVPPGVMISEFMAANDKTKNDEDGDDSDWIELFNSAPTAANLNGWFLTDDPAVLTKWRFPNVTLLPNTHLLLFASEKDRTNPGARLHTNFKLDPDGDYLALVDPDLNIVSEFAPRYPPQLKDVSYGRAQGAPNVVGYYLKPTPGAPNDVSGPGFAPPVEFSEPSRTFTTPFGLTLATALPNAVIRYTLNGTLPTNSSSLYVEPINVSTTVQVRARAFVDGLLPGPPRSESYLALNANVLNFTSDLPVLIIHDFGKGSIPSTTDKFAFLAIFEPKAGRSSLTNAPDFAARAGLHARGSSTLGYPKQSWAVEFWDEFNTDKDLSPLGLPADSDWVMYAPNNFEPVLIHNPFIFQLSNDIGAYAPRTRFLEVYLNTTGGPISAANYFGIYVLEEKITRGPHRVDVAKLEPEHTTPPSVTGGYMLKIDRLGPGESGLSAGGQGMAWVEPKEIEMRVPQRAPQVTYIRSYLNSFNTALSSVNFTDPVTGYRAFVDTNAWIDHSLLNVLAMNVDALRLSAYFGKAREGKLFFGPIWDFDRALGSTDGRDSNPRVWRGSGDATDFFNYPWWGRMFRDLDFWQRWIDRYQDLRAAEFSTNHINALIDSLANQVRQAQPREQKKWGIVPSGGYQNAVNSMKNWLSRRVGFMDTNFVARPVLGAVGGSVPAGFQLTLSGPAGATVYYTLDGSDPRLPKGGVSPGALTYQGPLTLNANARVVARANNPAHKNLTGSGNPPISSTWSGSVAATYVVETPPLVITELMYHPQPPPTGNTNDADNFEYIELKNVGAQSLSLVGARLSGGVDYTFTASSGVTSLASGGTVLVVKNRAAFSSRYPAAGNVAGEFLGNLGNGGERLVLEGVLREPVLDFRYENQWYPITDGHGYSLVIVDEHAPLSTWGSAASWRPSAELNGSPGQAGGLLGSFPPIKVNEALTHTDLPDVDAIELHNPVRSDVNIGGWFLTDDFNAPKKFRIPGGTTIKAGGFRLFDELDFNSGAPESFSLSSLGDELYLFSAENGELTGYVHGFRFGAAANGVSFGRYVTSTGEEHFVAQIKPTLRAPSAGPNAGSRIGPVVISEIMFSPPSIVGTNNNALDEFIELRNITGQLVPLFDPNAPTNTWRLAGGAEFTLPRGLVLPADGALLIVNFDPVRDLYSLNQFRTFYGLDAGVAMVGPYGGKLENTGERLSLYKPDPPQTEASPNPGFVPYVLVDQVRYASAAPWPTDADGTGKSLQRRASREYGDDPINWESAPATPGRPNPGGLLDSDGDGLPDDWEVAHGFDPKTDAGENGGAADPDGDGFTNAQELASGTDPRDALSHLNVTSLHDTGEVTTIRFTAVGGRSYSVLYSDDLANGAWQKLADVAVPFTTEATVSDPSPVSTARFYRLVTPWAP